MGNSDANNVTPAEAGVQKSLKRLDSGFRRNDARGSHVREDGLKLTAFSIGSGHGKYLICHGVFKNLPHKMGLY